jgi:hypothetical protein
MEIIWRVNITHDVSFFIEEEHYFIGSVVLIRSPLNQAVILSKLDRRLVWLRRGMLMPIGMPC